MCCVDKVNHEHLAILSDLKSCQFATRIVCDLQSVYMSQFEDSQIISPKLIPVSHHNIQLWQMRAYFLQKKKKSFSWYIIQNS